MFTKNNSIEEILREKDLRRYLGVMFPAMFCDLVPETYRDVPLKIVEQEVKMPWGAPFLADELVRAANKMEDIIYNGSYKFIPLWAEENVDRFLPEAEKNNKESVCLMVSNRNTEEERPAAIICPGGGYEMVARMRKAARWQNAWKMRDIKPLC